MFSSTLALSPLQQPWPENLDLSKQGVEVPGTRKPGQTGHYQNGAWGLKSVNDQPHVRVLPDVFELGFKVSANDRYLGYRPVVSENPLKFANHYVWETYSQVDERRRNIGSALHKLFSDGVIGGAELDTVGIWSQNRPEWQIIDLALHAYGKVGVSLYDTLGKDSVEFIINHAHLTVIFATAQHIPKLLTIKHRVPALRMIVSIDDLSDDTKQVLRTWGEHQGVQVKELRELEEFGRANKMETLPARPEQIATLCYTSGTTGDPKGAILTHGNLVAAVVSNCHGISFGGKGLGISYLPLAHIYERINILNVTGMGGATGFFSGDVLRLLEDMQILKPNYFPSVPRVLNRIYQTAMLTAQVPGLKGFLFRSAVETKLRKLRETGDSTHAFWDKLVFRKVQAVLGGNIRLLTTGSAPISVEAMDFLRIAFFAAEVVEGYGMTENCGTLTRTWSNDPTSSGTVGAPQPSTEIKLVDVPAMGYTAENKPNPRGEICVRGEHCFIGYYKDDKKTRETIDDEGWVHTGDVGEFDSCGRLKIIDRVKNIVKLSQGEYVALEKIENVYDTSPLVAQMYVHGDSLRDYLVGVVVPEPINFAVLVGKLYGKQVTPLDIVTLSQAAKDPRVVQVVLSDISKEANNVGLKGFETVKKIHLTLDPFTIDNNMLTPTLKLRRRDVAATYKDVLNALYSGPEQQETAKL